MSHRPFKDVQTLADDLSIHAMSEVSDGDKFSQFDLVDAQTALLMAFDRILGFASDRGIHHITHFDAAATFAERANQKNEVNH